MRRDVQKNKNKQKQELKNKKIDTQKSIYSSEGAYMNITTINLNRNRTEIDIKLPFNFIVRDATELSNRYVTYLCRVSDLLILTITGMEIDYDLINIIKRLMPTVVIVHDKKLKSLARAISKSFGSPKTCDFSMLNMALWNIQCQNTTIASERPFMVPADTKYCDGLLIVEGFMKNSLRSDRVVINGEYRGIVEEVTMDGESIEGRLLNVECDESAFKSLYEDCSDNSTAGIQHVDDGDPCIEEVDLESQNDEDYDVEYGEFYDEQPIDPELDLINKYSKYKGIRSLSVGSFVDRPEEMPEHYKDIVFLRNIKHVLGQIKNRECIIPKNKSVVLKIRLSLPSNEVFDPSLVVLFNLFEYEGRCTILNYEFSSQEPLPEEIVVDNGFEIFRAKCIVTRNLNSNAFKQESSLVSGIVSFVGPLALFSPNAFVVSDFNSSKAVKLFNGYSQNRLFFDCVELKGKPVKICKRYIVVKGMFYTKEQVEYFRNIQLEARRGIRGFVKKSLGTKGAFKAYFAQPVKYGEEITMSLYKRIFL
ncbi:uncharacterized protein VICG_01355 [Vittaforma corneae ATCC 50505]|uniref:Ribosome biogenesis protein BMS1/TSR1 C-terminal domain-containing protein n=1 Tax=Vittaforma corneae (strain ATCC 50505) TaxID=993615 RepID=L2GMT6_VITCO|nr:uncharacterized protein VICG_01355 [Vittaforma corneae ATCC 50505]ELA41607.1 hypothetical protein VICG_01355 [Vittaforma corneae ATCC 50505]